MYELIKVKYDNESPLVSGRELHEFLEVETPYTMWFKRMCEYGFVEGADHITILLDGEGVGKSATKTDHAITLDMAKELSMIQRSEKGKEARQYFIAVEKEWNSPERVMARALQIAERTIQSLSVENDKQKQLIGELQPKADYVDYILSSTGTMTISQIAADYGMSATALNKILRDEKIQRKVGDQWILYKEHMNNGYTKSETINITRTNGTPDTKLFTKWTQKGRLMINEILNRHEIFANMDLIQTA